MDYYLIFGMVAVALIAIYGFLNSFKKTIQEDRKPIQDLNLNVMKLNTNFEHMLKNDDIRDIRLKKHGEQIDEIKEKQKNNEARLSVCETKVSNLEKWREC